MPTTEKAIPCRMAFRNASLLVENNREAGEERRIIPEFGIVSPVGPEMQFVALRGFQEEAVIWIHPGVPLRDQVGHIESEWEDSPFSIVAFGSGEGNVEHIARIRIRGLC